ELNREAIELVGRLEISTCPPGSTVSTEPLGSGWWVLSGTRDCGACGSSAVMRSTSSNGAAGSWTGCTVHSSSTPSNVGGPCLKHTDATYASASARVRIRGPESSVAVGLNDTDMLITASNRTI